jgi:hypothetical protein
MTIMGSQQERTERIEALRGLIERLSAPDLTLAQAKVLRGRMSELLEGGNRRGVWDQMSASPTMIRTDARGDGQRQEIRSSDPRIRVAG